MPITQCRRLIACCMTLVALTPLTACGNIGGGGLRLSLNTGRS